MADDSPDPDAVFRTALIVELGLGVLAMLLGWLTQVDVRQWIPSLVWDNAGELVGASLGGMAAAIPMLILIWLLEKIDWEPIRELHALERLPIISSLLRLRPVELIAVSFAAGVGEELLLRGWLMGWLIGPLDSASLATILLGWGVSSIAFGLMHPITPAYAVIATGMGLYLGGLLLITGNLLVPIFAHAAYDAAHLLLAKSEHGRSS